MALFENLGPLTTSFTLRIGKGIKRLDFEIDLHG